LAELFIGELAVNGYARIVLELVNLDLDILELSQPEFLQKKHPG
jgi:hypothetical protein